jgi:NADH-quinone oxidoreductase subunit L
VANFFTWLEAGDLSVDFAYRVDELSLIMGLIITGVGSLIHVYSIGYMHGDVDFGRFFAYMNLFAFAMLMLVLGDSLLLTFLGWEGVGACSYLLISFWFTDEANASAGKKAFITNRIGDWGFMVAIFMTFATFGSVAYVDVLDTTAAGTVATSTATFIALMLFVGAIGKSAQFPLYLWLPDAMAGPTPVSALIHAATMVTSGIYLLTRVNPIIADAADWVPTLIAWTGAGTALFAATIAVAQRDIKKVLAYSTISQLGYMFLAVGCGAYVAAVFHMVTHAFFKALLFLGSGSVIHGMDGDQDMAHYGGLRRFMPVTAGTFVVGWLAIAGVPPFAGFWSKDEILAFAWNESPLLWLVGLVTAVLTAFYMTRLVILTFFGRHRYADPRPDEVEEAWASAIAAADEAVVAASAALDAAVAASEAATDEPDAAEALVAARAAHEAAVLERGGIVASAGERPELPALALYGAPEVGPVADRLPDEVATRSGHHPHESPWTMGLPLVVLAVLSVLGGLIQLPFSTATKRLEGWLEPTLFGNEVHLSVGTGTLWVLAAVAVAGGVVGILVAVAAYLQRRVDHRSFEQPILADAWRFDRLVSNFMGGPGRAGFEATADFDSTVVDGAVESVATMVKAEARLLRRFHNGLVRTYAAGIGVGAVGLVVWFLSRTSF